MTTTLTTLAKHLFGIDVRSLAAVRIALAILVLIDLGIRATDLKAHYTDWGLLPRSVLLSDYYSPWQVSLHLLSGLWQIQVVMFLLAAVAALMLLVGYRTRAATIITWFFLLSLHYRNPLILQAGDVLLRMGLFWGMFLPWNQRMSVDAALHRVPPQPTIISSLASAALLIQVALVYLGSSLHKSAQIWLLQGNGLPLALQLDQFATPIGAWMRQHPPLTTLLSRFAYILELTAAPALFFPLVTPYIRLIIVALLVGFHLGIFSAMEVGLFPWIDIASVLAFLPSAFWEWLTAWCKKHRPQKITLYYDGECSFCHQAVQIIETFLVPFNATSKPAATNPAIAQAMLARNSWVIVDEQNQSHFGYDGFLTIVATSPFFHWLTPLLRFSPVQKGGSLIYRIVATHRTTTCDIGPTATSPRGWLKELREYHLSSILVGAALVYVIAVNLAGYPKPIGTIPPDLARVSQLIGLEQKWNMFSPFPYLDDGWYVIPGTLRDGTLIDVFQSGAPVTWEKPADVVNTFKNDRWRKYLTNLWAGASTPARLQYGRYLCRQWNDAHAESQQLMNFKIYYMLERTSLVKGQPPAPVEPHVIWEHLCFG